MNAETSSSEGLDREIERLLAEMAQNPAITCPIRFVWGGTQELAEHAGTMLRVFAQLQKREYPWMDFTALREIVFHHDYKLALQEAGGADIDRWRPSEFKGATAWR